MSTPRGSATEPVAADENKRYYKVDEGYDKRVYENTALSCFVILIVFLGFYCF